MSIYFVGDVQGCMPSLHTLLAAIDFSPSTDTLYLLGDLVNRGPDSLGVLRWAMGQGTAVRPLLGNHDLHLLAVAHGIKPTSQGDTLQGILDAPDRTALMHWLLQQPLARLEHGWLMVHAGVLPQWSTADTIDLATQASTALQADPAYFLRHMYGNTPASWHALDAAAPTFNIDKWRITINALTRLRFCTANGSIDFSCTQAPSKAPAHLVPWFDAPERQTQTQPIAFGHWASLGQTMRPNLLGLDTGCVWGNSLSAIKLNETGAAPTMADWVSVACHPCKKVK